MYCSMQPTVSVYCFDFASIFGILKSKERLLKTYEFTLNLSKLLDKSLDIHMNYKETYSVILVHTFQLPFNEIAALVKLIHTIMWCKLLQMQCCKRPCTEYKYSKTSRRRFILLMNTFKLSWIMWAYHVYSVQ